MSKKEKKEKGLTTNEKKFIKNVLSGDSRVDAYQKAYTVKGKGPNRNSATISAYKKANEPRVKNELEKILRDEGIDEKAIADTLNQLKRNRDWKAKDAFIGHAKEMLGYKNTPQQQLNFQQNIYNKREEYDI